MLVQVHTDRNIPSDDRLEEYVRSTVEKSLGHLADRITRVEVHLSDDNAGKTNGEDKRCLMEARPAGMKPVAATHLAGNVRQAIDGAADKLARLLNRTFGRLDHPKARAQTRDEPIG